MNHTRRFFSYSFSSRFAWVPTPDYVMSWTSYRWKLPMNSKYIPVQEKNRCMYDRMISSVFSPPIPTGIHPRVFCMPFLTLNESFHGSIKYRNNIDSFFCFVGIVYIELDSDIDTRYPISNTTINIINIYHSERKLKDRSSSY